MKVAPAVAEVLGVVDDAAGRTEGYGEVLSVAHAAAAPAAPVEEEATAPRPAEMECGPAATNEVQPGAGGSIEFLGRWNEKESDRAMPVKMKGLGETDARLAFGKFVDELVQNGASSGIFATGPSAFVEWDFSWSASPDDKSYQRHGFVGMDTPKHENVRFADFEGVVDDLGAWDKMAPIMAVYRVTLPRGGLRGKWAGRPPPLAPEDLYTGPRSDGLLSTDEISGKYSAPCCSDLQVCRSMTVVPLGADAIETWRTGCVFFPPFIYFIGPVAEGAVLTRNGRTNAFRDMTFSADGTAKRGCDNFKKCRTSQKRAFQKVETRDLAGKWRGCCCSPFVPFWPFSSLFCTTKTALNEDQYEESGSCCFLGWACPVESTTRTRKYVNGHPTNGFATDGNSDPNDVHWHRDPGCAGGCKSIFAVFAKKAG